MTTATTWQSCAEPTDAGQWLTPPACQGQIVLVSYASGEDGVIYRRVWDEWHVDLKTNVTVENLGSYPACPDSRQEPDLRAIRVWDQSDGSREYAKRLLADDEEFEPWQQEPK